MCCRSCRHISIRKRGGVAAGDKRRGITVGRSRIKCVNGVEGLLVFISTCEGIIVEPCVVFDANRAVIGAIFFVFKQFEALASGWRKSVVWGFTGVEVMTYIFAPPGCAVCCLEGFEAFLHALEHFSAIGHLINRKEGGIPSLQRSATFRLLCPQEVSTFAREVRGRLWLMFRI